MRSYQPWLDSLNQDPERLPFAWTNVWHWHNFWPLLAAALFMLFAVVYVCTVVYYAMFAPSEEPDEEKHSSGRVACSDVIGAIVLTLIFIFPAGIFAGVTVIVVYNIGAPAIPSQTVSFVQYVKHETGVAGLSCPRLDSLDTQDAPNGGWYQCKTGKDAEPLLLYVDRQAHAFSLQDHASDPNRHVNPVNLDNYQPIEETVTYSPSGWIIALFALAVIGCLGSIVV